MTQRFDPMAANATLHCLTGCAIGEIVGLMIGTAYGWSNLATTVLAIALAFLFGYALSSLPVVLAGVGVVAALQLVLAADTLSILTMEVVDNLVMLAVPGAMDAGLDNPWFWASMTLALVVAFLAAYPVNVHLMNRGKGHALTHAYMGHADHAAAGRATRDAHTAGRATRDAHTAGRAGRAPQGEPESRPAEPDHQARRRRTSWTGPRPTTLAIGIAAFMLGGFVASLG